MKLLNYTTSYIAGILLIIVSIWAGIFYYAMLDEIYDSIDDGLDNQKLLILDKASSDTTVFLKQTFDESGYSIRAIDNLAINTDVYIDTSMYMRNEKDFEPVRMLTTNFKQGDQYYELKIVTSMVEEDDLITELLYAIIGLYICIIIAIIFLNNVVLKKIWSPFHKLLSQLRRFKLDNQKPLVATQTKVDEFQMLNETVEEMLQRNIEIYVSQKNFIENAAHELQTPLAIAINKLEALTEDTNIPEEQLRNITAAIDNLSRLTRLNKALLLLSRIENNQFHKPVVIDINKVVTDTLEAFKDQLEYNGINVMYEEKGKCRVTMDPELANSMILNLVKNAMIYNVPDGFIKVIVSADSFVIENTGIKSLDPTKVFTRFYKEKPASGSNGLGLAITRSITSLYGFDIQYEFANKHIIKIFFRGKA